MDRQAQRDIRRKLNCLRLAQERGSNVLACRDDSPIFDYQRHRFPSYPKSTGVNGK